MNGMAKQEELKAPTFLRYANVLSTLAEEEIEVLGLMIQERNQTQKRDLSHLKQKLDKNTPLDKLKKKYGGKLTAIQQSLLRTGLVSMTIENYSKAQSHIDLEEDDAFDQTVASSIVYSLTPLMDEILKYTDFINFEDMGNAK